jgi:integrase
VVPLGTGMRLGEILGTRWRDVDLERRVLRVASMLSFAAGEFTFSAPKTPRARRSLDLPQFVVAFLHRHHREQNEEKMALRDLWGELDLVFEDGIGQPLSQDGLG